MYHIVEENQVPHKEKSLLIKGFFQKDSQIADNTGNWNYYLDTCTDTQKKIAHIIDQHSFATEIELTNRRIADLAGCTVRTVTRCTTKFHKDGFIIKSQEDIYDTNRYVINDKFKKGKLPFSNWFNSLSPNNQELYNSHGIRIDHKNKLICSFEYVHPISSLILDSLSRRRTLPRAQAHTRQGSVFKKTKNKKEIVGVAVKDFQKQWILSHRSDPRVKDMLNNPKIKSALITPVIEKISTLLTLDDKSQLKLIVFPEEALEYAFESIEPVVTGKKAIKQSINDRLAWFMSTANAYCVKNKIKPDWPWYYSLCEILGVVATDLDTKPVMIQKPKAAHKKQGIYAPWESPKELPFEDQKAKLNNDIQSLSQRIESNTEPSYMISYAMSLVERKINELRQLEAQYGNVPIYH